MIPSVQPTQEPEAYSAAELRVLENIAQASWIFDFDACRVVWANRAACRLWHVDSSEELAARDFEPQTVSVRRRLDSYRTRLGWGEKIIDQWTFYPPQGPLTLNISVSGIVLDGRFGMLVFASHVDSTQVDEDVLRGSEALRHVDVMVTLFAEDGSVLFQNVAAEDAFGVLDGQTDQLRARFASGKDAEEACASLAEVGRYRGDVQTRLPYGVAWHVVELRSTVDPASGDAAVLETREDISERRWTSQALERAKERAEAADKAKSAFLASMSHELRTPLNAILGYSELLQEEFEEADMMPWYSEDLDRIHRAGRHLLGLINNVLDLSKIEAGQMEIHVEPCNLDRLVSDVLDTLRPLAEAGRNELRFEVEDGIPTLLADATRLRQILMNLVGNSIKFTSAGTIDVVVRREHGMTTLQVRDTGIGMSPEEAQRIFEPFTQSDASIAGRYGGTGLGLTITRRFCELMGGEISLESVEGEGSTFTVTLPLQPQLAPV